jgi:hypothetical protein
LEGTPTFSLISKPTLLSSYTYQQNIKTYKENLRQLKSFGAKIGWARLLCIVAAITLFIWQWPSFQVMPTALLFIFLIAFFRLVVVAVNNAEKIDHTSQLIAINEEEIAIAAGHYHERYNGEDFLPTGHDYAQDLDLLGRASLYQYTHRAESQPGRRTWVQWLLWPADTTEIVARQQAAKQIAGDVKWRQRVQATGRLSSITNTVEQRLLEWQSYEDPNFSKPIWQVVKWVGPLVSITLFIAYLTDAVSFSFFLWYLLVFFIITGYISKLATPAYLRLGKMANEIKTFADSLACIEQMPAGDSPWLQERKQALHFANGETASVAILQLNGLLKRMDYRLNPVAFIPLNILLFWDLQQMVQLRKWQLLYANSLTEWMQSLGDTEAIVSIGTLTFNHPDWAFPTIDAAHGIFESVALGHPLIDAQKRVVSDFSTRGVPMVNMITGSNMAGKSTFLRSIGLAQVMAQAGAPVCAKALHVSHMRLMSSMRIADNLEENTSTFYAELKKLKQMIDAVNANEKVLLLMDEILRGTNSFDRHKGSKALIEQLIHHKAVGLVATHDLELADLKIQYPAAIANYHFDVQVAGEELYFDYALKTGVCKSLNASILMKKIGIELD